MTNMNNTKKTNGSKKVNTVAITAIALTAVIGAGSIGGLALAKQMRTNKTATTTTYAAKDNNKVSTVKTVATVNTADTSAAEAKAAAKSAAQAQKDAEKALAQAKTERAAAEKAAAQATAENKAAAQKTAEQKKEAEKAAQKKADDAKKTADTKKKEAKKASKAVVNWSANFFYANGNSVKVRHFTNGRLVSADGIRYTDNGDGTLTGTDGSILFSTSEAADAYAQAQYEKANTVNWSATFYCSNGVAMNACHYVDGRLVGDNGVEYTDNGNGTLTGTDGSIIFTTCKAACDYVYAKHDQDYPENWSATFYTATGDAVTIHHYTDGRYMSDDKTQYTVNADGSISTWSGSTTLFTTKEAADAYAQAQYKKANPDDYTDPQIDRGAEPRKDDQTVAVAQAQAEKEAANQAAAQKQAEEEAQRIAAEKEAQAQKEAEAQAQAEEEAQRIAAENEAAAQKEAENQAAAQAQAEAEAQRIADENKAADQNNAENQDTTEVQDQTEQNTTEETQDQNADATKDENADQDQQNVEFTAEQQAAIDKAMEDGQLTADEVVAMGLTVMQAQGLGLTVVNA